MDHQNVIDFIETNPICLMTAKALFGGPVTHEVRPVEVKQHGFNCNSGGWSLYGSDSESPAYFLVYKRKARRKASTINCKDIDELKPIT